MKCNSCWIEISPGTRVVTSVCGHLFCLKCPQSLVRARKGCPLCSAELRKNSFKVIAIQEGITDRSPYLWGQLPEATMKSALGAIEFYNRQLDLKFEYLESEKEQKAQKIVEVIKERLGQTHSAYLAGQTKHDITLRQNQSLKKSNEELNEKLTDLAKQRKELEEELKKLSRKLRREIANSGETTSNRERHLQQDSTVQYSNQNSMPWSTAKGLRENTRTDIRDLWDASTTEETRRTGDDHVERFENEQQEGGKVQAIQNKATKHERSDRPGVRFQDSPFMNEPQLSSELYGYRRKNYSPRRFDMGPAPSTS